MDFGQEVFSLITKENLLPDEIELVGCSEHEIEHLKQAQQVDFIAATYGELMRVMGHSGIECLLDGQCAYNYAKDLKQHVMRLRRVSPLIPEDAFFFLSVLDAYFYFSTQNHNDNPAVYMVYEDAVTRSTATFTEFVEHKLHLLRVEKNRRLEDEERSIYYDPHTGSFYINPRMSRLLL